MPAAAVIPALIAYIKVVAVKKLVVGFRHDDGLVGRNALYRSCRAPYRILTSVLNWMEVKEAAPGGNSRRRLGVPIRLL